MYNKHPRAASSESVSVVTCFDCTIVLARLSAVPRRAAFSAVSCPILVSAARKALLPLPNSPAELLLTVPVFAAGCLPSSCRVEHAHQRLMGQHREATQETRALYSPQNCTFHTLAAWAPQRTKPRRCQIGEGAAGALPAPAAAAP